MPGARQAAASVRFSGLDRRAGEREVITHLIDIATDTQDIGLHVDDDHGGVRWPQVAVPRPGIGAGVDKSLGHAPVSYRVTPSSPGAPRTLCSGEQVAIIRARVRT